MEISDEQEVSAVWLIGDPVAHSLSPAMHNAAFAALGLPHRYETREVKAEQLEATIERMRREDVLGEDAPQRLLEVQRDRGERGHPGQDPVPRLVDGDQPLGAVVVVRFRFVLTGHAASVPTVYRSFLRCTKSARKSRKSSPTSSRPMAISTVALR